MVNEPLSDKGTNKPLSLIVGLGNPGAQYAATRHNVGFWFLDAWARQQQVTFRIQTKFFADVAEFSFAGQWVRLLKPTTYMNRSGQSVAAMARFYRIEPTQILIVHDDLDLPLGQARLKQGGGHGGHNGLRDIIAQLGNREFIRLRLGVSHPGHRSAVLGHVLGKTSASEREQITTVCQQILDDSDSLLRGDITKTMNWLHRKPTVSSSDSDM